MARTLPDERKVQIGRSSPQKGTPESERASHVAVEVAELFNGGSVSEALQVLERYRSRTHHLAFRAAAEGLEAYLRGDPKDAVFLFRKAKELFEDSERPPLSSPYSVAFVNAQLMLRESERPAVLQARTFYRGNLQALRAVDPVLAREVARSTWPRNLTVVDLWAGLCLCAADQPTLYRMQDELRAQLAPHLTTRKPIAFGGVGTGQELAWCLDHQVDLLHGMARPHYLFEEAAEKVKALLHLRNFRKALTERHVILFSGKGASLRAHSVFRSLRYASPEIVVGDARVLKRYLEPALAASRASELREEVQAYYGSAEFTLRQRRIALGEDLPRILINTCRWTTFLKYCAADFEKAFQHLGCRTRYLIEEDDVQTLLPALYWRELAEFKPDAVFMVSHARPSMPAAPRELPFIGYIQDKCGPLLSLNDLRPHIERCDLFVCLSKEHRRFLVEKGVQPEQTFLMPVPVDELLFHPVPYDADLERRYGASVSFVKHGTPHREEAFRRFLEGLSRAVPQRQACAAFETLFQQLYQASCRDLRHCWTERDMEEFLFARIASGNSDTIQAFVKQQVALFHCLVYSPAWRYQFLEALDQAGIQLVLYGKNWEQNARVGHLSRGPVDRERELNYVYNFSKVNLSINHSLSMTHRLVECALAGGFMMVAAHNAETDTLPASDYFTPGSELITFRSCEELIEKCRWYLAHPEKRREIAQAMRQRALKEGTARAGAQAVLSKWRELLRKRL